MSGIAWRLRRLTAMSPSEIAHRARVALRDHVSPPAWARRTPGEAFERLFPEGAVAALRSSRLDRLVHLPAEVGALEFAVAAA